MTHPSSWEAIAHTLAARLMYAAYCPERHDPPEPDCPSCEDIAAYQRYVAKCEQTGRIAMATSVVGNTALVTLDQVLAWPSTTRKEAP